MYFTLSVIGFQESFYRDISCLVLLGAFISRVFQLILVKLLVVFFFVFYNNKSRFSIRVFTVEPICTQRSVC